MQRLYVVGKTPWKGSTSDSKLIRGTQSCLTICDGSMGPWYPVIREVESPEVYSFYAGSAEAAPDLDSEVDFPDGDWLALRYDKTKDQLILRSDLFLRSRWYYIEQGDSIYLSNSLLLIRKALGTCLEINWPGAYTILRFGYLPGHHTPLEKVRSLRSGQTLHVQDSGIKIQEASLVPPNRETQQVSHEELFEILDEAVRESIGKWESVVLPLSGGMDSRLLLRFALRHLPQVAIKTITFGHHRSLDYQIGRRVAQSLGVENIALPMDTRPLAVQAAENFPVGEGMYWSVPEYPIRPFAEELHGGRLVLSGYIGDVVFGSYEPEVDMPNREVVLTYLLDTVSVLPDSIVTRLIPRTAPLDDLLPYPPSSPLRDYEAYIYGSHQMNRTNFALFVDRKNAVYATPYVHLQVLRAAYSFSDSQRQGQSGFARFVEEKFPELWHIPLKIGHGLARQQRRPKSEILQRVWWRIMSGIDGRLGTPLGKVLYRHPRLNYAHPREWLSSPHCNFVLQCTERLLNNSPLDQKELCVLRDSIRKGKGMHPNLLKGLVTLAQWDEYYGAGA